MTSRSADGAVFVTRSAALAIRSSPGTAGALQESAAIYLDSVAMRKVYTAVAVRARMCRKDSLAIGSPRGGHAGFPDPGIGPWRPRRRLPRDRGDDLRPARGRPRGRPVADRFARVLRPAADGRGRGPGWQPAHHHRPPGGRPPQP